MDFFDIKLNDVIKILQDYSNKTNNPNILKIKIDFKGFDFIENKPTKFEMNNSVYMKNNKRNKKC